VFTGETLPDGRTADAVYLVLHDFYREILDHALTRPLDYDYLKGLPPAAQRLYEVLSYALFAALKNHRPRARLAYSEFCRLAPLTRHFDWERVRVQMAQIHASHRKSGYLAGVEFEATADHEGRADWTMSYLPGPKAQAEHLAFTTRGGPVVPAIEPPPVPPEPPLLAEAPPTAVEPEPTGLAAELEARGVSRAVAAELVREFPEERLRRQIEVVDWLRETKPKRIKDLGAYLAKAIREDYAAPAGFEGRAARAARETTQREAIDREAEARRATARAQAERDRVRAYWEALPAERRAALDAAALAGADPADRAAYEAATAPPVRRMLQAGLRDAHIRRLLGLPAAD
jgi:hypothetical protein